MDLTELTNKLATAQGLDGVERTKAYDEALNMAFELFGGFSFQAAVRAKVREMEYVVVPHLHYVNPTHSLFAFPFENVFRVVPGLKEAYHRVVVEPLFAGKTDGYFDVDPVLNERYWQPREGDAKGVM